MSPFVTSFLILLGVQLGFLFFAYLLLRRIVRDIAQSVALSMQDLFSETTIKLDKRLRKVEALVVKDLMRGGDLYENLVGNGDEFDIEEALAPEKAEGV